MLGTGQQRARSPLTETPADRVAHDREPRAVVEDGLDMHLGDDVRDTGQHVVRAEHGSGALEGLREPGAVAGGLADGVRDQRGRLRHVEPQTAGAAGAGQLGGSEEQQPVTLRGSQSHGADTSSLRSG